jgi:hypothetical protein
MIRLTAAVLVLLTASGLSTRTTAASKTRFWNLTGQTITHLYLAPAGTTNWGTDQCRNDPDGSVDDDERLTITGVTAGHYDAKLTQTGGRVCVVKNIAVKPGAIFSIDKKALTNCG